MESPLFLDRFSNREWVCALKATGAWGGSSTCLAWMSQLAQAAKSKVQGHGGFFGLHCAPPLQIHSGSPDYLRTGPHSET